MPLSRAGRPGRSAGRRSGLRWRRSVCRTARPCATRAAPRPRRPAARSATPARTPGGAGPSARSGRAAARPRPGCPACAAAFARCSRIRSPPSTRIRPTAPPPAASIPSSAANASGPCPSRAASMVANSETLEPVRRARRRSPPPPRQRRRRSRAPASPAPPARPATSSGQARHQPVHPFRRHGLAGLGQDRPGGVPPDPPAVRPGTRHWRPPASPPPTRAAWTVSAARPPSRSTGSPTAGTARPQAFGTVRSRQSRTRTTRRPPINDADVYSNSIPGSSRSRVATRNGSDTAARHRHGQPVGPLLDPPGIRPVQQHDPLAGPRPGKALAEADAQVGPVARDLKPIFVIASRGFAARPSEARPAMTKMGRRSLERTPSGRTQPVEEGRDLLRDLVGQVGRHPAGTRRRPRTRPRGTAGSRCPTRPARARSPTPTIARCGVRSTIDQEDRDRDPDARGRGIALYSRLLDADPRWARAVRTAGSPRRRRRPAASAGRCGTPGRTDPACCPRTRCASGPDVPGRPPPPPNSSGWNPHADSPCRLPISSARRARIRPARS